MECFERLFRFTYNTEGTKIFLSPDEEILKEQFQTNKDQAATEEDNYIDLPKFVELQHKKTKTLKKQSSTIDVNRIKRALQRKFSIRIKKGLEKRRSNDSNNSNEE